MQVPSTSIADQSIGLTASYDKNDRPAESNTDNAGKAMKRPALITRLTYGALALMAASSMPSAVAQDHAKPSMEKAFDKLEQSRRMFEEADSLDSILKYKSYLGPLKAFRDGYVGYQAARRFDLGVSPKIVGVAAGSLSAVKAYNKQSEMSKAVHALRDHATKLEQKAHAEIRQATNAYSIDDEFEDFEYSTDEKKQSDNIKAEL